MMLRLALLAVLCGPLGSADAFVIPVPACSRTVQVRARLPLSKLSASSGTELLTRRDSLAKAVLGGAGLVLGKKFFEGGIWTDTPDLIGRTIVVTGVFARGSVLLSVGGDAHIFYFLSLARARARSLTHTHTHTHAHTHTHIQGGNTGLGKETCIRLAKLGATVVLASRSQGRGDKAAEDVRVLSNSDQVSSMVLDLASLKSVESFAQAFQSKHNKLDVLVNNAGVMAIPTREVTAEGFEKQLGINHFGHFHLTNLLMPQLKAAGKATGDARIINLSSEAHQIAFNGMNWDDLQSEKEYDPWKAYGQSKLANVLFTRELSRRLSTSTDCTGVWTASVHPGVVRTELGRNFFIPPSQCESFGSIDCKVQHHYFSFSAMVSVEQLD